MKRYTYSIKDELNHEMMFHGRTCEDCQNLDESVDKNGRTVYFCKYYKEHISRRDFEYNAHYCSGYDPELKWGKRY